MPFEVRGDEPLDQVVNVRLSTAEKAGLQMEAEVSGLTLSSLVRRRCFRRRVIPRSDLRVIGELRRLAGLLKLVNLQTEFRSGHEVSAALQAIRLYIEGLNSGKQEEQGDQG